MTHRQAVAANTVCTSSADQGNIRRGKQSIMPCKANSCNKDVRHSAGCKTQHVTPGNVCPQRDRPPQGHHKVTFHMHGCTGSMHRLHTNITLYGRSPAIASSMTTRCTHRTQRGIHAHVQWCNAHPSLLLVKLCQHMQRQQAGDHTQHTQPLGPSEQACYGPACQPASCCCCWSAPVSI